MKNYITAIFLAIFAIPSFGQSISIFDIDTTNFPTMEAKFYVFDKDGKPITPNISDLQLTENGINRTITNVSCPNIPPYTLSVGIMVDTYGKIDLARKGVAKLVDFLTLPQDEIGITYMAKGVYIHQDFTKNKQKASASASKIPSAPGVDINSMFYSQNTGGIPFIKDRKSDKKILILVSDLHCPNLNINEAQLIADAKANDISIYSVLLGTNDYAGLFNRIAKGSGGKVFEKVSDENQIKNIFQEIERIEHYNPCNLTWISDASCNPKITNIELKWQGNKTITSYLPTFNSFADLKVIPNFISYGKRIPNSQKDTTITLTAQNTDFIVIGIKKKFGFSDFKITNTNFPFTIKKNTSVNLNVRFEPSDSNLKYASFEIETDKCPAFFSANGGFSNIILSNQTLKLLKPNGGESFIAGSDTNIMWDGISPTDTVSLELSIDSGKTWKSIISKVSDLNFNWKNIPLPQSNDCLIRINQQKTDTLEFDLNLSLEVNLNKDILDFQFIMNQNEDNLYIGLQNDGIAQWQINQGKLFKVFYPKYVGWVNQLLLTKDDKYVLFAGPSVGNLYIIEIWDKNLTILQDTIRTRYLYDIKISSDNKYIYAACDDNLIRVYEFSSKKLIKEINTGNSPALKMELSKNGDFIAYSIGNSIIIKDIKSDQILNIFPTNDLCNYLYLGADNNTLLTIARSKVGYPDTISIWNIRNGELINNFIYKYTIQDAILNYNCDKLIAINREKLIIWDLQTNNILFEAIPKNSFIGELVKVTLNKKESELFIMSYFGRMSKYNLNLKPFQQDISDSVFSIIAPEANFNKLNIDMGKVVLGQNKDTMITDVLCNIGAAPLHVLGVDVTNGNVTDFMVPRGAGEFYLPPNECRDLMFDFMPTQLGKRNAKITVKSTIGDFVDTINITGEGIAPQLEIVNNLIDFGLVDIGSFKDTIQVVSIKNVGSAALNINNSLHLGPNDIDFNTLSGAAPFSLNAGETAKMNLRFAPKAKGRTSGRLQFEFNGAGSPATVQLFGTGTSNRALIKVGSDTAFTQENVEIPVEIDIPNSVIQDGVTAISFELEMNKTILFPIGVNSTIDGDNRIIKFDSVPIKNVGVNEVAKLKFIATLGNAEETVIRVRNLIPIGNDVDFDVIDGNFKLLGVCKEGGERFLVGNKSKTMLLSISPNPATESIEIEYSNADEGEAEIIISNLLGQTIITQKLEKTQNGYTKLDLSQIPTGQYSILFKTETVLENRVLQVIK